MFRFPLRDATYDYWVNIKPNVNCKLRERNRFYDILISISKSAGFLQSTGLDLNLFIFSVAVKKSVYEIKMRGIGSERIDGSESPFIRS